MTATIIKVRKQSRVSWVALILGLVLPFFAQSQNSDLGNWLIYIGSKQLNEKWNIHNEVQYRNYNMVGDLEQLLLRTGLGYTFNEGKNNALLGYGYILSENYSGNGDEKIDVHEHRIFQQFIAKDNIGRVRLQHRYRFEQRFVESDFKMRFRYFLAINVPVFSKGRDIHMFYLSAYNEIFLNTESPVFDRNRLYGGIGYQLSKGTKLELGYMNQFFENGGRDQLNMVALVTF